MALSMSSPSPFTQRVYGVSFSVANFFAISSETSAVFSSFAMVGPIHQRAKSHLSGDKRLRRLLDLPRQELLHQLRRHLHVRAVLGRVLQLLEVVQAGVLEDAVHRRDEAHGPLG